MKNKINFLFIIFFIILIVLIFYVFTLKKNVNHPNSLATSSLVGTWIIKDSFGNEYIINAYPSGMYLMSASDSLSQSFGNFKKLGQNHYDMTDWSFVYDKNQTSKTLQKVDGKIDVSENGKFFKGNVIIYIMDFDGKVLNKFTSSCTGNRLYISN